MMVSIFQRRSSTDYRATHSPQARRFGRPYIAVPAQTQRNALAYVQQAAREVRAIRNAGNRGAAYLPRSVEGSNAGLRIFTKVVRSSKRDLGNRDGAYERNRDESDLRPSHGDVHCPYSMVVRVKA